MIHLNSVKATHHHACTSLSLSPVIWCPGSRVMESSVMAQASESPASIDDLLRPGDISRLQRNKNLLLIDLVVLNEV